MVIQSCAGSPECRPGALHGGRAPAATVEAAQLEIEVLACHPGHDVADAAPRIEPRVQDPQLLRANFEGREAERGPERGATIAR